MFFTPVVRNWEDTFTLFLSLFKRKLGFYFPGKFSDLKMEAFGGFVMDEQAIQVENVFLEFLKRFVFFLFFPEFEVPYRSNSMVN